MRQLIRGDAAERDLDDILTRLAERSAKAAEDFAAELDERCRLLTSQPLTGRPRDDLLPGLRSVVVGHYVVFFTSTDTEVLVRRIIHGARNITTDMFDGP